MPSLEKSCSRYFVDLMQVSRSGNEAAQKEKTGNEDMQRMLNGSKTCGTARPQKYKYLRILFVESFHLCPGNPGSMQLEAIPGLRGLLVD